MKSSLCAYTLLVLSIVFFVVGIGALVGGIIGSAWMTHENTTIGLRGSCSKILEKMVCSERKSLFKFEEGDGTEKDIIFILLIAAVVFCLLALICALTMFCYRNSSGAWKCATAVAFSFGLVGALMNFAALGYAESAFEQQWSSTFTHGWSAILAWVAAIVQLLAAIFACCLICVTPEAPPVKESIHYRDLLSEKRAEDTLLYESIAKLDT